MASESAVALLESEARALLARLARIRPIVLVETMVPAAAVATRALLGIEQTLAQERDALRRGVENYLEWLGRHGATVTAAEAQRRFTLLRLRFNAVIAQYDLFSDAITQRSEQQNGVWLAGLDVLADDALRAHGIDIGVPPVLCYLDRGPGAAIRRARTRLPGDVPNPVALIRVPRERMVGHGIASSLVHEVGHQVAALLDLVPALTAGIEFQAQSSQDPEVWGLYRRWVSEQVADLWSVGHLGIASTLGLVAVVSLPKPFVFRINTDGPHPTPWIRVHLSCAFGRHLYPDPMWDGLLSIWTGLYPLNGLPRRQRDLLTRLAAAAPACAATLLEQKPARLDGRTVADLLPRRAHAPARLRTILRERRDLRSLRPTQAMAVLGLGRLEGSVPVAAEGREVDRLLESWALARALVNEPVWRRRTGGRPSLHGPQRLAAAPSATTTFARVRVGAER
jgi:hypothetical protein